MDQSLLQGRLLKIIRLLLTGDHVTTTGISFEFVTNLLPRLLDDFFLSLSISVLLPWLLELFPVESLAQTMHCMPTSLLFVTKVIQVESMQDHAGITICTHVTESLT